MVWPLLARMAPELAIGAAMVGSQWMSSSRSRWARRGAPVVGSAGFLGAGLLRPDYGYRDEWIEVHESQGFDPRRWGQDLGGSPYGMGRW